MVTRTMPFVIETECNNVSQMCAQVISLASSKCRNNALYHNRALRASKRFHSPIP